jgi:transcriptional regulator with XRE-family HTH domain
VWTLKALQRQTEASIAMTTETFRPIIEVLGELRGFDSKQSDIAEAIGIAQSHISAIEHGQREIGALILLRLSRHYGKSIEWLLTGTDS